MTGCFHMTSCGGFFCQCIIYVLLSLVQISLQYDDVLLPPKFPDFFSSFSESLSSSEALHQLIVGFVEKDLDSCGCNEVVQVNWTQFNANIGSDLLPFDLQPCLPLVGLSTHLPNVAAVSSGHGDPSQPLIIGLCVGFVVIVLVIVIFLTVQRFNYFHAAWDTVKKKSLNLRRRRSNVQSTCPSNSRQTVTSSASDSMAYSDTASVTEVGCFNFPLKVKTVLLPIRCKKDENNAKIQDNIIGYEADPNENSNARKLDDIRKCSNVYRVPEPNAETPKSTMKTGMDNDEKRKPAETLQRPDDVTLSDATHQQKPALTFVGKSVQPNSTAWNQLPTGRPFLNDKDDLVDYSNIDLFSYSPRSAQT